MVLKSDRCRHPVNFERNLRGISRREGVGADDVDGALCTEPTTLLGDDLGWRGPALAERGKGAV